MDKPFFSVEIGVQIRALTASHGNLSIMRIIIFYSLFFGFAVSAWTQAPEPAWRVARTKELAAVIPDRAPVEKERIETDAQTAAGVTDGKGRFIAGVVLITAGYAAHGKYSHYLIVQASLRIGEATLPAGDYVFGYRRADDETLEITFYQAATGKPLGTAQAKRGSTTGPIRSLTITPPGAGRAVLQIGRFACPYVLEK